MPSQRDNRVTLWAYVLLRMGLSGGWCRICKLRPKTVWSHGWRAESRTSLFLSGWSPSGRVLGCVIIAYQYQPSKLGFPNPRRSGPQGPGISATAPSSCGRPWRHIQCWTRACRRPGHPGPQSTWLQRAGGAQPRLAGRDFHGPAQWDTGLLRKPRWCEDSHCQSNICFHSTSPQQGQSLFPPQLGFSSKRVFQILWASVAWYHHYPTLKGREPFPGLCNPGMQAGSHW